jgi:hypothetical protein
VTLILFLRPGDPGSLIGQGGDLDNRLKVLFDGLRMPTQGEMVGDEDIQEEPLYCLLEDDGLISALSVRTDRLLQGGGRTEVDLTIEVTVRAVRTVFA